MLLVDCDANRSTLDWCQGAGEAIPQNLSDDQYLETCGSYGRRRVITWWHRSPWRASESLPSDLAAGRLTAPVADLLVVPTSSVVRLPWSAGSPVDLGCGGYGGQLPSTGLV